MSMQEELKRMLRDLDLNVAVYTELASDGIYLEFIFLEKSFHVSNIKIIPINLGTKFYHNSELGISKIKEINLLILDYVNRVLLGNNVKEDLLLCTFVEDEKELGELLISTLKNPY